MLNQEQLEQGQATVGGIQKTLESLSLGHGIFQKDLREQGRRGFVAVLNCVHADDTRMYEKWTLITTLRNFLRAEQSILHHGTIRRV